MTRNLFGVIQKSSESASDSSMAFALLGVAAASRHEKIFAILMIDGRAPQAFTVGSEIVAGVRLESVEADHVLLATSTGNQVVRLLERPSPGMQGAPK